MPVTVMLTPWEVYTAVLVTVRVIVFRDILQPPTRYTLILSFYTVALLFFEYDLQYLHTVAVVLNCFQSQLSLHYF